MFVVVVVEEVEYILRCVGVLPVDFSFGCMIVFEQVGFRATADLSDGMARDLRPHSGGN